MTPQDVNKGRQSLKGQKKGGALNASFLAVVLQKRDMNKDALENDHELMPTVYTH